MSELVFIQEKEIKQVIATDDVETLNIDELNPDVSLSETHNSSVLITDHPIESGSSISDHKIKKPITLSVTAIISDTPLGISGLFQIPTDPSLSREGWERLLEMQKKDFPITVITGLKAYKNMQFESLVANRNSGNVGGITFTAKMKEIVTVASLIVGDNVKTSAGLNIQERKDTGRQRSMLRSWTVSILAGLGITL